MITLYQFPISHYCEKIRWTLAYKQIDYEVKNLLPGLHSLTTSKIATQSSVPILVHDEKVIQGSSQIISYLDENFIEHNLTPIDDQLKAQALEWEDFADREIGPAIRSCFYNILLEHPNIVIPFFVHQGPWYGKFILPLMFPTLKVKMCELMDINEVSAKNSKDRLSIAIDKLYLCLQKNSFLAGNEFSRADLSTASLLAPLRRPKKYGLNWPDHFPEPLENLITEFNVKTSWVDDLYEKYRV